MPRLPNALYSAAQVRELDRLAIEEFAIPGATLMERAGAGAFAHLREHFPKARRLCVLCGPGNNGGDGFVVARLARTAGMRVTVCLLADEAKLRGDALNMVRAMRESGLSFTPYPMDGPLPEADLYVDALLGTGLKSTLRGDFQTAVAALNASGKPVVALDIPTGLNADSGAVMGVAVRAALTVTFIGLKRGLFSGCGAEYRGSLRYEDLRIPAEVMMRVKPEAALISSAHLARHLAPRARHAHKGDCGHVLVIGGDSGMSGAARMAGEAALRAGAGLVSLATRAEHAAGISAARPELMCHPVEHAEDLDPLLARATVVAIGPGLGRGDWGRAMLAKVLDRDVPLVIDADALNLLAAEPMRREDWILTPHAGEAARLLATTAAEIQADRFAAARELREKYAGVIVLKGSGTLIEAEGPTGVCAGGNPGMASGGMGDVLSGLIAGLLAQLPLSPTRAVLAARLGVCIHSEAADLAARREGERGLLASDLPPFIRRLVNPGQMLDDVD